MNRILGLVLLVAGIILLVVGYNSNESLASEVSEAVSGNPTDETMWYLIAGAVASIIGVFLLARRTR